MTLPRLTGTLTSSPSRSTVKLSFWPSWRSDRRPQRLRTRLVVGQRGAVDLAEDVADRQRAVGRASSGRSEDLEGRLDGVVQRAERHRDRGVLGGHHLHLALVAVLLGGLVVGVDRLWG